MSDNSCDYDIFYNGFTELSFFNLNKKAAEEIYKKFDEQFNVKKNINYDFKFIYFNDDSVNASVDHDDNTDYVYVNVGTVGKIYATFYSLFTNSKVFPEIGDVKKEFATINVDFKFDNEKKQLLFTGAPNCPVRRSVADFLSLVALRYVTTHELGHIFNGHAEYLNEKTGLFTLSMFNNNEESKFDNLDYKTIEMDADAAAMTRSVDNILSVYEKFNSYYLSELFESKELLLKLWSFAIFSLFLVFEDEYSSENDWKCSKYLPNMVRCILNFDAALGYTKKFIEIAEYKYDDNFYENFNSIIFNSIRDVEKYYNESFNTHHNIIKYIDKNTEAIKYSQIVLNNWINVKPKLEKYTRTKLYDKNMKLSDFIKDK